MRNEFKGARARMRQEIIEAYLFLRKNNLSMSIDTLEFMKDASIEKLDCVLKEIDRRHKLFKEIIEQAEKLNANKTTLVFLIATMNDEAFTKFHKEFMEKDDNSKKK